MDRIAVSELTLKASAKRVDGDSGRCTDIFLRTRRKNARCEDTVILVYKISAIVGIFRIMVEFRNRTAGTTFLSTDSSFVGNMFLTCLISAASTALRWISRHLDFSGSPVNFRVMFMKPGMS